MNSFFKILNYDLTSPTITKCIVLAASANGNDLLMTKAFNEIIRLIQADRILFPNLTKDWVIEKTTNSITVDIDRNDSKVNILHIKRIFVTNETQKKATQLTESMDSLMMKRVEGLLSRVSMICLGLHFDFRTAFDNEYTKDGNGRVFLQVQYNSPCTKTGEEKSFSGRKWYLSRHMTDDEIIKTAYAAFEAAIKHEVMEGFKVDNKILFNPHINFEELLSITDREVQRMQTF